MPEQWYYSREKKKFGPFSGPQLVQMARAGQLLPSDVLVAKWDSANSIKGLFSEGTAPAEGANERDRTGDSVLLSDIIKLTANIEAPAEPQVDSAEVERLRTEIADLKQEVAKYHKALERQVEEQTDAESRLRSQVELLQEENRAYRERADRRSEQAPASGGEANPLSSSQTADMTAENNELRQVIERMHGHLKEAEEKAAGRWKTREQEYEGLLDEKSEVIRQLHSQLKELQNKPAGGASEGPTEEELLALHEQLQQERQQLKEDEKSLHMQARDLEVQMSKERADLARQRGELQRLQNDLKRELEVVSRDAAVREKLAPLYKLQEEILNRRAGEGQRLPTPQDAGLSGRSQRQPVAKPAAPKPEQRSGFFRRLFQRDEGS